MEEATEGNRMKKGGGGLNTSVVQVKETRVHGVERNICDIHIRLHHKNNLGKSFT